MLRNSCPKVLKEQNLRWSVLVLLCSGHRGDKWSHSVCVLALRVPGHVEPTGPPLLCDSVTQRTCPCHFLGEERYGDHANLQMTAQLDLACLWSLALSFPLQQLLCRLHYHYFNRIFGKIQN